MSFMKPPWRCAWIDYLNILPVKIELQKLCNVDFITGHPLEINAILAARKADFGITSSIAYLLNNPVRENFIAYGIGCKGAVQSVYFGFKNADKEYLWMKSQKESLIEFVVKFGVKKIVEFTEFRKPPDGFSVQFTKASETSVALAKIFLGLFSGEKIPEASVTNHIQLLIGDEALIRLPEFDAILDLSEMWHDVTGLPFVFALWQIYGCNELKEVIAEASEKAKKNLAKDVGQYVFEKKILNTSGVLVDLESYWSCLDYKLTPSHLQGLELFFTLYKIMSF